MNVTDWNDEQRARFWARVDTTGACHLWTWGKDHCGYGVIKVRGKDWLAHRVAYELCIGPIPAGLEIDHVRARGCQHRHCVNPAHLEAVTHAENVARTAGRRVAACRRGHPFDEMNTRTSPSGFRHCRACDRLRQEAKPKKGRACGDRNTARAHPEKVARGERNGNSRLTEDAVRSIREHRQDGDSISKLSRDYAVSRSTISYVVERKKWRHVA